MGAAHVETAQQTLAAIARGDYHAPSGAEVDIAEAVAAARTGTVVLVPDAPLATGPRNAGDGPPRLELTAEKTAEAARRLVEREGERHVAALNFASGTNAGGGFLTGAQAQEEDLARCSALYPCLEPQRTYYQANRAAGPLYTDHVIYSPAVPFFRAESGAWLETPFALSIVTAPAPNAGAAARETALAARVDDVLARRARRVLAVAAAYGHRCLILGAWGCGVFRNDPAQVAAAFTTALAEPTLAGAFERVVFAVYDPNGRNLAAFERHLGLRAQL